MKLNYLIIICCLTCVLIISPACFTQVNYDNHIIFDNSLTDSSYYHSRGNYTHPGFIDLIDEKIPVDTNIFFTPPNSLRLKWNSGSGGSWKAEISLAIWRERDILFYGDTLGFWCYSKEEINSSELPIIKLTDINGHESDVINPGNLAGSITADKWHHIKIPLKMISQNDSLNLEQIKTITFSHNGNNIKGHTLYIDEIKIYSGEKSQTLLVPPSGLNAKGYDRHVDLIWTDKNEGNIFYNVIYRSTDGINFRPVGIMKGSVRRYSDYTGETGKKYFYKIKAVDISNNESGFSEQVSAETYKMSEDELLSMVQEASFRYYWEAAHPDAGLSLENIPGNENLVAIGAAGFGIMALVAGIERRFISRDEGVDRMLKIVRFLKNANRFHGAWPHFLDGKTGKVIALFGKYDNGADLVETAFLVQGLLAARQYFNNNDTKEKEIFSTITELWEAVEWDWFRREPGSDFLFWHWSPDYEWHINHPLIGFNETMIVYLLAIASPTHSVPPEMYYSGWAGQSNKAIEYRGWGNSEHGIHYYNGSTFYNIKLDVGIGTGGPLFFTHYSFLGFDPRLKKDKYTNYFENNRNIALINHAYCADNPGGYTGYSDSCWGLTASDDPWGYKAHSPVPHDDNGTITPTGALSSFPYTPDESMKALKYFYYNLGSKLWGIYGFRDAFNLTENWVANIYMGLNQAPVTVMTENYRSGLIWNLFMSNTEIKNMVKAIGFDEHK